jgi:hypothetical protein
LPPAQRNAIPVNVNWVQLLQQQARITAVAPVEALNALEQMLPTNEQRELALALAAAVMMIEPTLANPRSEIIEFLIGTLGVDPERVIGLAKAITDTVGTAQTRTVARTKAATSPAEPATPTAPAKSAKAAAPTRRARK